MSPENKSTGVFRIIAPHFRAGGTIHDGQVFSAPPIIAHTVGWTCGQMMGLCRQEQWELHWTVRVRRTDKAMKSNKRRSPSRRRSDDYQI